MEIKTLEELAPWIAIAFTLELRKIVNTKKFTKREEMKMTTNILFLEKLYTEEGIC